jgi:hypothetical protein
MVMRIFTSLNRFRQYLSRSRQSRGAAKLQRRLRLEHTVRPAVECLEDRCLLSVDYTQIQTQLPTLLNAMQSAVTQTILADPMPLVGSGLKSNSSAAFLNPIATNLGTFLKGKPSPTPQQVQDALFTTLNGMKLFPTSSTENQDVQVSPDGSEFVVHINNTQNPLVLSEPFDLGLPKFGLTASGNVQASLTYQFDLAFIVANQGGTTHVSLDTSQTKLTLNVDVTIPSSLANATFGPLGLNVFDGAFPASSPFKTSSSMKPSEFKGTFTFDVTGPNVDASTVTAAYFLSHSNVTLKGNADVNLAAELTVQNFPAMALNLQVHWPFTRGNLDGDVPTVSFNDVQLDVGSLLTEVLKPYASDLHKTLTPINAVVQMLNEALPVVSFLAGHDVSLLDIAETLDPKLKALEPFLTAFNALFALDTNLITVIAKNESAVIDDGSFTLGSTDPQNHPEYADPRDPLFNPADPTRVTPIVTNSQPSAQQQLQGNASAGDIFKFIYDPRSGLEGSDLGQLQLQFLDSPPSVFQALLGQQVTLLQYSTPMMESGSGNNSEIRIGEDFPGALGPFGVRIDGNMDLHADLTVGFDTSGLLSGHPLEGIFVSKADASLTGQFAVSLDFDPGLVFDPYIQGAVNSTINLSLPSTVYLTSAVLSTAENNPLSLFN